MEEISTFVKSAYLNIKDAENEVKNYHDSQIKDKLKESLLVIRREILEIEKNIREEEQRNINERLMETLFKRKTNTAEVEGEEIFNIFIKKNQDYDMPHDLLVNIISYIYSSIIYKELTKNTYVNDPLRLSLQELEYYVILFEGGTTEKLEKRYSLEGKKFMLEIDMARIIENKDKTPETLHVFLSKFINHYYRGAQVCKNTKNE
jgi:hypothetical protein